MPITSSAVKALDMYSNKMKIEFKRTILNTTFYKSSFCFFTFKGINVTIQRIGKSMFFEHFFCKNKLKSCPFFIKFIQFASIFAMNQPYKRITKAIR